MEATTSSSSTESCRYLHVRRSSRTYRSPHIIRSKGLEADLDVSQLIVAVRFKIDIPRVVLVVWRTDSTAEFLSETTVVLLKVFDAHPRTSGGCIIDVEGAFQMGIDLGAAPGPDHLSRMSGPAADERLTSEVEAAFSYFDFVDDGSKLPALGAYDRPIF